MVTLAALPLILAAVAGIHGLRARKAERLRFQAHSERLQGLPYGRR